MTLTALDALLLFLVSQKGETGYGIRQLFQSTPAFIFSDSPGAIYPALARLEARGLLLSHAAEGGRRKRVYEAAPEGRAALHAWLTGPVQPETVARRPEELDLRFVMVASMLGSAAARSFLTDYAAATESRLRELEAFRDGPAEAMGGPSRDAIDLGARLTRTRLQWCRDQFLNLEGS